MTSLLATLFDRLLDRIDAGLAEGSLTATLPGTRTRRLGGRAPGPDAVVDLVRWRALGRLVTGGSAGWYVAWSKGEWRSPDPTVLFELFMRNRRTLGGAGRAQGAMRLLRHWRNGLRRNSRSGSKRNIEFHYDLGNGFYRLWLDPSLTYSSALFAEPVMTEESLEAAQARKNEAVLDRLALPPGARVLEIGCGWGGFAEAAARRGLAVDAITLSAEQERAVNARIATAGLTGVTVSLTDYRDVTGQYDGVASIEMVEAVGQEYWGTYLAAISRALKPGARAAIQYIAIDDAIFEAYAANVDFIQRFVFPGGMLLSESRFRALAEQNGLEWRDRHGFGLHYAETLRRWRDRFDAAVASGRLPKKFDQKFIDLWRYYLMYCEGGFRGGGIDVAQVTLVKGA
ncbi:cyclopropane-fatty-acyl-phospholipid synthase [Sphingomonas sp. BE270]|jgi:cyclopropane-fatty-acyl-phospholipid synthase|uniref:SAM-dependent methyltransferase n=1 Tax=unclassified Sphingomonas TaxID=196159 RepID=UPI00053ED643|nr:MULTISPECIES: cyclopropane-fatty-acyl-phospholipid synthase family protein [unclassified Sphingomonas]MDR6850202.1 cyclopropane-fatty-acyl-phospholipid synthase [Sphingomonas sp. BE137]MDR7257136.1 cyclopropane-fatty-acyl-phospholipid synthase [Sphingomonas sp. BE270]